MSDKLVLKPSPEHPITVEPFAGRVLVKVAGAVVADSAHAIMLREASYPPVLYIPREDVKMELLERSQHGSYCPYKGDAAYYSVPSGGPRSTDAAWTYEAPYEPVKDIKDHLAFYPDRVDAA